MIDSQMPVMNTLQQTQKAGADNTMKVHSTQTQCVVHVVVEALLEIKAMTAQMKVITKAVMKVKMRALTKVKKKEKMMQ